MIKVLRPMMNGIFTDPVKVKLDLEKPSIFLAGPCPRTDYNDDWRFEAIKYLEELGWDGIVFNPTNPEYNTKDPTYLEKQTKWEVDAMRVSTKVVFWIPRDKEHPALTTNIELGYFLDVNRMYRAIIGMPDWAEKNNYIKIRLKLIGKSYFNDLKEMMTHVAEVVK